MNGGITERIVQGHGNHTANDFLSTAYWYRLEPHKKFDILPVGKRFPVMLEFANLKSLMTTGRKLAITPVLKMKKKVKS